MSMLNHLCTTLLATVIAAMACVTVFANEFASTSQDDVTVNLGTELSEAEVSALPRHVFAEGAGLPQGSGTAEQGAKLYALHCASCHGSQGQGAKAVELVGDRSLLDSQYPDRGIAVYWPYAPTLYEYIDRSMPPATPGMFSSDELYSLIAHLLVLNDVLDSEAVLDSQSLSNVQLPNRQGFTTIAQ